MSEVSEGSDGCRCSTFPLMAESDRPIPLTKMWMDAISGEYGSPDGLRERRGSFGRIEWEDNRAWGRLVIWLNGEICEIKTRGQLFDLCKVLEIVFCRRDA